MGREVMSDKRRTIRRPFSGIYSVQDAAVFLRATTPPPQIPLRVWEIKRKRFVGPSSRHICHWIRRSANGDLNRRGHLALNFEQLIRARMIVLFRTRGLPLRAILAAEANMHEMTGKPQPFITEQLWSSSSDMFFELEKAIRAATRPHQLVFDDIIKEYMTPIHHGLEFDASGLTTLWKPMASVMIDPELQFGSPCIEGTRVETESLWSFHRSGESGESVDTLAEMFALTVDQVEAALAWEGTLARAA